VLRGLRLNVLALLDDSSFQFLQGIGSTASHRGALMVFNGWVHQKRVALGRKMEEPYK